MDSLLANYASSDDENDQGSQEFQEDAADPSAASKPSAGNPLQLPQRKSTSSSSLLSPLPPPWDPSLHSSSSSPFSSLARPKTLQSSYSDSKSDHVRSKDIKGGGISSDDVVSSGPLKAKSSILSALPPPKSSSSSSPFLSSLPAPKLNLPHPVEASTNQNPKKIVQIRPKIDPSILKDCDSDDDLDDEKKRKESKNLSSLSLKSISSILPAPRNISLGSALSAASGASRRSVVEADEPASNGEGLVSAQESGGFGSYGGYEGSFANPPMEIGADGVANAGFTDSMGAPGYNPDAVEGTAYPGYPSYSDVSSDCYSGYGIASDSGTYVVPAEYGTYGGSWYDGSATIPAPEASDMRRIKGKRGRGEAPIEIVEVKQDELMKNRPREDQAKLTGIAFGPSYKPVSSVKEKPTKLHKRKHQIGSLYFDMKQNESELAERRSRGLLTKAQTHGKYGW